MKIKNRIGNRLASIAMVLLAMQAAGFAQKHLPRIEKQIEKGHFTKAENKLKEMYAHDSSAIEYYYYKGEINRVQGNYNAAEKYFSSVLTINPGSSRATAAIGKVYAQDGQITKAIAELNTAIIMDSANAMYYNSLGAVYFIMNEFETALPILLKAYKLNPRSYSVLYNLGITYSHLQEYNKAIVFLSKSLKKYKNRRVYAERGYVYYKLKKDKKALRNYNKALRMRDARVAWDKEGKGELYYQRAQVWKDLGKQAKYEKDTQFAKQYGYNN